MNQKKLQLSFRNFKQVSLLLLLITSLIFYPSKEAGADANPSFLQSAASTGNNTTYTAAAQNFGTPATDRFLVFAVHARDGGDGAKSIESVTLGGVQATIVGQVQNASGASDLVGLAIAQVPSGSTGDVVVTFNTSMERMAGALYRVDGIHSIVPYDIVTSTADNPSGTIDVPAGGFVIGAANTGDNTTATWTGLVEDYDAIVESNTTYTGAMEVSASAQSSKSVQVTFGSNNNPAGIFASWSAFGDPVPSGQTTFTSPVIINEDAVVTGSLAKGSGTFVIDHPLDPVRKLLYHSFVESPDVKNVYDGVVTLDENGIATVKLPDYFEALNKDHRFLLTPIGKPAPELFIQSNGVVDNQFTIAGGPPGIKISWQVTGIRQDPYILANPIINEVMKGPDQLVDIGEYLFKGYLDVGI